MLLKRGVTSELTEEQLQKERSAATFLPWVEDMLKTFGSSPESKAAVRFRRGLAKQLVEEALPLGIFALHHYCSSEEVRLRLVLGNQNHDAVIDDQRSNPSPFCFVEVTQAHAGEEEHLRMLALEEHGHVNMLGAVRKSGTKATGIRVEVEPLAESQHVVLIKELERIEAAVRRKARKEYPEGTALLVVFDDYISIKDSEDLDTLRECLKRMLPDLGQFSWLSVVGWSKRTLLEFNLTP